MTTVHDVARYILKKLAPNQFGERVTAWKLQKLVYYTQAWSLVWDEKPLFDQEIQAWANGPVCPDLYQQHKGRLRLFEGDIKGDADALTDDQKETVDAVLEYYGDKTGQWLSDLTHMEDPWCEARKDVPSNAPSQEIITLELMSKYFESLAPED